LRVSEVIIRPEEPQSFRDLALVLAKRNRKEDIQRAITLLVEVIQGDWDIRFSQVEVVALQVHLHVAPEVSPVRNFTAL
jgi:hypothetical protein